LGTEIALLLFASIGVAFVVFVSEFKGRAVSFAKTSSLGVFLLVVAVVLFPGQGQLYMAMHPISEHTETILEEGVEGVVVTSQAGVEVDNWINGLAHGGRPAYLFYYQTLEALTYTAAPEEVLLIGFGTGSIGEMIEKSSAVKQLTLVELNESLLVNLKKIPLFEDILNAPKLDVNIEDGRRFLLRTDKKFDLVAMDPLRSTTSYSNNIYSRQFFELVNDHLSDDGVLMLFTDEYKVLPNTINAVFDYVRVYSFFVLASNAPFERHPEMRKDVIQKFPRADRRKILTSGRGTYIGDETYIAKELAHYPINQDWKPVTEYYIGLRARKD
jgi:spermidine synthase